MHEIVKKIKEKKELSGLADSLVEETLLSYLKKSKINLSSLSPQEKKLIIKDVRSELRKFAGQFQYSMKKRENLLEENKIQELLETHSSTRERFNFYPELKKIIHSFHPKSILDLGCGLNPIAISSPNQKYYAMDINSGELSLVKKYFEKNKIDGEIIVHDLRKPFDFPQADICLILKLFDVLEKRGHKLAEKIILSLKCRVLIISFSTRTLANKPMNHPQRGWIEWLLERLGYSFKTIKSSNEIFYIAEKSNQ